MGLEVVEETYMDLHRSLAPTLIVPDSLRLAGHKSVAASIAAAQAVLTNTLSPTSHRKKKSGISNNVGIEALSQPEHYSFSKEVDQIKSLGKIGSVTGKLQSETVQHSGENSHFAVNKLSILITFVWNVHVAYAYLFFFFFFRLH